MKKPWDFVEKYYPDYYSSYEISYTDDLKKIIDNDFEESSEAAHIYDDIKQEIIIFNGFCEDFMVADRAKEMLYPMEATIYEKSIKEYLKTLNNENI